MKKFSAILLIISLSIFLTGCTQVQDLIDPPQAESNEMTEEAKKEYLKKRVAALYEKYGQNQNNGSSNGTRYFITMSANGISPAGSMTIKQGDTVEWANNSSVKQKLILTISGSQVINQELDVNKTFAQQFDDVGEFTFQIDPLGITSSVKVEEKTQTQVTTTPVVSPTTTE